MAATVAAGHNLAPECEELLKVLSDGEWWEYEKVMETVGNRIPPGRALRKAEERLESQERKMGPRKRPPPSDESKIRSGRRALVTSAFHSMANRYLEFELDDLGRRQRVRRREETIPSRANAFRLPSAERRELEQALGGGPVQQCMTCGSWIADAGTHAGFHDKRWGKSGQLLDAEELRGVIRSVVVSELRAMSIGLRSWMKEHVIGREYKEDSEADLQLAKQRDY